MTKSQGQIFTCWGKIHFQWQLLTARYWSRLHYIPALAIECFACLRQSPAKSALVVPNHNLKPQPVSDPVLYITATLASAVIVSQHRKWEQSIEVICLWGTWWFPVFYNYIIKGSREKRGSEDITWTIKLPKTPLIKIWEWARKGTNVLAWLMSYKLSWSVLLLGWQCRKCLKGLSYSEHLLTFLWPCWRYPCKGM